MKMMSVSIEIMKKKQTGFTLLELLITVVVASIIMTLGVPSFQSFFVNNRMSTHANELISSLNLARSEAIKRATQIKVCSSSDQASCGGTWTDGWIVITADDVELIRVYGALKGPSTLTSTETSITYTASGFLTGPQTTFTLCDSHETGELGREVIVTATGRPGSTSPYPTCS
jgi:type IV fimbrial biogenesis protein FimT